MDRVLLTGRRRDVGPPAAVAGPLHFANRRGLDPGRFAAPRRDARRAHAGTRARAAGLEGEFLPRRNFRQADRVAAGLTQRGPSRIGAGLLGDGDWSGVPTLA